jgi:hypothetical protein
MIFLFLNEMSSCIHFRSELGKNYIRGPPGFLPYTIFLRDGLVGVDEKVARYLHRDKTMYRDILDITSDIYKEIPDFLS